MKGLMNLQIPLRRLGQTELLKFALVNTKNELAALEALSELHARPPTQTTQIAESGTYRLAARGHCMDVYPPELFSG